MKLRFSIRDLLWLVVVAAMAFGWWTEHQRYEHIKSEVYQNNGKIMTVEGRLEAIEKNLQSGADPFSPFPTQAPPGQVDPFRAPK